MFGMISCNRGLISFLLFTSSTYSSSRKKEGKQFRQMCSVYISRKTIYLGLQTINIRDVRLVR